MAILMHLHASPLNVEFIGKHYIFLHSRNQIPC